MTEDHRALIERATAEHQPRSDVLYSHQCVLCGDSWPCLTARLANALEEMSSLAGAAQGAYEDLCQRSRAALEQAQERLGTIAGEAIAATASSQLLMLIGKEREKRDAAQARAARLAAEVQAIKAAIEALDLQLEQQAGPDGFVEIYVLRTGPWHKLLGFARGVDAAAALDLETP